MHKQIPVIVNKQDNKCIIYNFYSNKYSHMSLHSSFAINIVKGMNIFHIIYTAIYIYYNLYYTAIFSVYKNITYMYTYTLIINISNM